MTSGKLYLRHCTSGGAENFSTKGNGNWNVNGYVEGRNLEYEDIFMWKYRPGISIYSYMQV